MKELYPIQTTNITVKNSIDDRTLHYEKQTTMNYEKLHAT